MGNFVAEFDGSVVAEPEEFTAGNSKGLRFPVYVNERRKNRDTEEYEDTGNVSKIQVTLWNDLAENTDVRFHDIVEVKASLTEREYEGKNGKGRQLQTTFVNSVTLKYRAADSASQGAKEEDLSDLPW